MESNEEKKARLAPGQHKIEMPNLDKVQISAEGQEVQRTIGSMMGEIVWLMSQSPAHKHLSLGDLEWMLMPPIVLGQYKLFRQGDTPVGAALWGYLSEEAEQRLVSAGRLAPQDWGNNAQMDAEKGLIPQEGGTLWLVEMITPFHNEQNKHREQMVADLMQTALKGKKFKTVSINAQSGAKEVITLG